MKKTLIFLAALALIGSSSLAMAEQSKVKVGIIAPLSGPLAEYGIAARNGMEIAKDNNPEAFKNIKFVYEDSRWEAATAVKLFNKLKNQDKASLVFNWGNPTTEAVSPLAERYKLPLLAMSANPSTSIGRNFVVRTTNSDFEFSEKLAEYLKEKNFKKLGVVIAENSYVAGLYDGLKKSLAKDQSIEIIDNYNLSDHDFRSTVAKIRKSEYDAIGVFLISGQVSEFYRQLQEQNVKLPSFGTDFFESTTEIQMAKGGMEGAVYTHLGVSKEFRKQYLKLFRNDSQIAYAGNGHDTALLIAEIYKNGNLSAQETMKAVKAVKNIQGAGGSFEYKETIAGGAYLSFPVKTKIIRSSEPVILE